MTTTTTGYTPARMGRPSKYEDAAPTLISMIREGATRKSACNAAGVSYSSLILWIKTIPEFAEAVSKAEEELRAERLSQAEASLYSSATGYTVKEVKCEQARLPDGTMGVVKVVETIKHVPPNIAATIYLLTHLAPDKWQNKYRDASEPPMTTIDGRAITLEDLLGDIQQPAGDQGQAPTPRGKANKAKTHANNQQKKR